MVEGSEPFDVSLGKERGDATDRIAMVPEIAHEPIAVAGQDEIVGGVALEVGQGKDGEVIEASPGPEILFGRIFAAEESNGGKVDGEDDA